MKNNHTNTNNNHNNHLERILFFVILSFFRYDPIDGPCVDVKDTAELLGGEERAYSPKLEQSGSVFFRNSPPSNRVVVFIFSHHGVPKKTPRDGDSTRMKSS